MHQISLPLAINMQLGGGRGMGVGVCTLHISYAQLLWHISNMINIFTIKLYTVTGSLEINLSVFITESFNFWSCPQLGLELLLEIGES